jgi:tetratricopeptide (TPR) repeat protein
LIRVHRQTAEIHRRAHRLTEAARSLEQAREVAARLVNTHPEDERCRIDLAAAYDDLGVIYGAMGKLRDALSCFDKAQLIHRQLIAADTSASAHRTNAARTLLHRGNALQKCGRPAEAASAFRQSITILEEQSHRTSGDYYDIACAQSLLSGLASQSGSGLTAAEGQAEADHAMNSLRLAAASGWRNPAWMASDTDLNPIRSRPDFQSLVLDLGFPADPFAR